MRRMVDTEAVACYVTGSSSKMLSTEIATEFRGRATSYELTPYSFREYARAKGVFQTTLDPAAVLQEQDRLDLTRLGSEYLVEGGYPEAQGIGAISSAATFDRGLALETAAYLALRREKSFGRKNQIMSYAVKEGSATLEVDFAEGDALLGNPTSLMQVSVSLRNPATRRRELRALETSMRASGIDRATIVTLDEHETIATDVDIVLVVPAWSWLLGRQRVWCPELARR